MQHEDILKSWFYVSPCNPCGRSMFGPRGIIWTELVPTRWCYIPNIKALCIVFSDKKICSCFPYMWPSRRGLFLPQGHFLNTLGRDWLCDATYKISKLLALWFQRKSFFHVLLIPAYVKHVTAGQTHFGLNGHNLNTLGRRYIPNIQTLALVVSDKKIFKAFISKIYF